MKKVIKTKKSGIFANSVFHQFLDVLARDSEINFDKMIPYTEEMQRLDAFLVAGVFPAESLGGVQDGKH